VFGAIAKAAGARAAASSSTSPRSSRHSPTRQPGFLRDNAYLGIIILTDEDDCSLAHYSLLASDPGSNAVLGDLQSFRCTRFGVVCDQGGQTPDAMNQVGTKSQCHPDDASTYLMTASHYSAFLQASRRTAERSSSRDCRPPSRSRSSCARRRAR